MIRHLLTLAWRRRRANALVAVEIAGCFVVLAAVASVGVQFLRSSRQPLGFRADDIWVVQLHGSDDDRSDWTAAKTEAYALMLAEARGAEGVVDLAGSTNVPYDHSVRNWQFGSGPDLIDAEFNLVTDDFARVMGVDLVAGRWFDAGDEGAATRLAVIDRDFARRLDPAGDAGDVIGRLMPKSRPDDEDMKVIGVVDEFRESGEMSLPRPYFFLRKSLIPRDGGTGLETIVLKMRPGAEAELEPALLARLRAVSQHWQLEVRPMSSMRSAYVLTRLGPLAAASVVALFLLATVALGLVGVLWQNVTRRTQELALRRAVGSPASGIRWLVVGELFVVASVAMAVTAVLAAQGPLLGLVPYVQPASHALGFVAAAGFILVIVALAGWHPGSLAMRATPSEALRSE